MPDTVLYEMKMFQRPPENTQDISAKYNKPFLEASILFKANLKMLHSGHFRDYQIYEYSIVHINFT